MMISNDYTIVVPHDWSSEEALTVAYFLEQVIESIWNLHGNGMIAAMRRRNAVSGTVKYQPVCPQGFPPQPASPDDDEDDDDEDEDDEEEEE